MARGKGYYVEDFPDFMTCVPNARQVWADQCVSSLGAIWGCVTVDGGQVPQVGQFLDSGTGNATNPVYFHVTAIGPANPSMLGNHDMPTVSGFYNCGYECSPIGCVWTGLQNATYTYQVDCDTAFTSGSCQANWYCDDYTCQEIMYPTVPPSVPPVSYWTMGNGQVFSGSLYQNIMSGGTVPGNPYPYTAPGGVWSGFTNLTQMASTLGPVGFAWTSKPGPYSWTPLHFSVDDCIACCGGINIQTYSNGTPNPHYGDYSTHPTIIPATQNAGFAAYLALNPNATMIPYLNTLGIHNCGIL